MVNGYHLIDEKQYIILSQSLQKQFVKRGNIIDYCPRQVHEIAILKNFDIQTDAMRNGLFFETLCIGGSAKGNKTTTLPKKINGSKYVHQIRIESQVLEFRKDVNFLDLDINPLTVQQVFAQVWNGFEDYDVTVILKGELDILSSIKIAHKSAFSAIDLKLTQDVTSTFSEFSWGLPNEMDHTQAYFYHKLTGLPFYYMVYDYKAHLKKKVPLKVNITPLMMTELNESIRKACAIILKEELDGWKPIPNLTEKRGSTTVNKCDYCKVTTCEYCKDHNSINQ